MPLGFFVISVLSVFFAIYRRRIPLLSPYGIFVAFQCLYNLLPWALRGLPGLDQAAVDLQLTLAAAANIAFATAILIWYRNYAFATVQPSSKRKRKRYLLLCIPLFVTTAVLCHYFGWHIFATPGSDVATGGMASVTAYFKHFCVAAYLLYLATFRLDRYGTFLFFGLVLITAIDGARTDIFPILVITLIFWRAGGSLSQWKLIIAFAVGITALMAVRGLLIGSAGLDLVLGPIIAEGTLGASSSIQSIFAVQHMQHPPYLLGIGSLDSWIAAINPWIIGEFAPLGGFYYVADGVANFGYIGPVLETFVFGWLLCKSEKWKQKHLLVYLVFLSTVGILFAKTHLMNGLKLFLVRLGLVVVLILVRKWRNTLALQIPDAGTQALAKVYPCRDS